LDDQNDEYSAIFMSLEVQKVVGDELLSWMAMICDLKILTLVLLFFLSSLTIQSIVIILMSNMSVLDEFLHVQELGL